jgi:hypothetical protein
LTNDLGVVAATFTENDVVSEFNWKPFEGLVGAANEIRGSFVDPSPASLYQLAEYKPVRVAPLDGIERQETVDYSMVQSRSQATRLSKTRLQRALYAGFFRATFQITAWQVQKGDIVRLIFAPLGLDKLFRVAEMEHRPDGLVPMTLREEDANIYAWSQEEGPPVVYPAPSGFDREMDPWYLLSVGEMGGAPPDANLLQDDTFGRGWTINQTDGDQRLRADVADARFPFPSYRPWALEMPLTPHPGPATYQSIPNIVPGRMYYLRSRVAKSADASGPDGNFTQYMRFFGPTNNYLGGINLVWTFSSLPHGGDYQARTVSMIAPAGTTEIRTGSDMNGSVTNGGSLRWEMPAVMDKEPGADITAGIGYGPPDLLFRYNADGTAQAGQFPRDVAWKLFSPTGVLTNGVGWSWSVKNGKVNGKTLANGEQPFSYGGNGVGVLTFASVEVSGEIFVNAVHAGKVYSLTVPVARDIAAPPQGGVTGGGGTTGTASSSKSSGFSSHSSSSFVETGRTELTVPTGQTGYTASFTTDHEPDPGSNGNWTVGAKLQVESPFDSGVWTDILAEVTGPSSVQVEQQSGTPDLINLESAALTGTVTVAASAGTNIRVRQVARTQSASKTHYVYGQLALTSP